MQGLETSVLRSGQNYCFLSISFQGPIPGAVLWPSQSSQARLPGPQTHRCICPSMPGPVDIPSQAQQGCFLSVDFLDNCVIPLDAYLPRSCECPSVPPDMTVIAYSDRCDRRGGSKHPLAFSALTESVVPPALVTMCVHSEPWRRPKGHLRQVW